MSSIGFRYILFVWLGVFCLYGHASEPLEYKGEKISLNFQDISTRAVLQVMADFTGLNIVASDSVTGNITLRLNNVPWDESLALILKSKGLQKRQEGNVLWIGSSEELAAREKAELQALQQAENLAPLHSEYIQINYAKALGISVLLKGEKSSLLSARGAVSVDERTNTLLVQETAAKIAEIRKLVERLDVPVRQVLIETRIVLANDDCENALGIQFGTRPCLGVANVSPCHSNEVNIGVNACNMTPANRLAINLPSVLSGCAAGVSGQLGLALAQLPGGTILDLELMALESEGLGKIISSPRLVTSDQHLAYIEAGEEIPYRAKTASGASAVAFKKAVLRLEVTPHITPDDHIMLNLKVNQDSRGELTMNGLAINTREMQTKVLVANGDTIVLGGIYEQTKKKKTTRVPILGCLPLVGALFRSAHNLDLRQELIIFVTPKIIKENVGCA